MASVIKQHTFARGASHPETVVFNVEDVQTRAREYLAEVQQQADALIEDAKREAKQLLAEAKQLGLEQAEKDMEQRVEQAAQKLSDARCKTAISACELAVSGVSECSSQWLSVWRNQTVSLAARIAEKLLRREMRDNDELLRVWLEEALAAMRESRELKIVVHPDDFAVAGRFLQQLSKSVPQAAGAEVIPDPDVSRGGCIVRGNNGQIDQQLETQLERLVEQLG